ncbi:hypothetical protein [Methylobacterium soli]|uniref:Uncharacterized protein n=1 Tax=Methylobacterium soli TaxID=553447 RepID=A0A6L3SQH6_9HYPH|nr:hypothetical protein [Methylobacterium soli]KAB1071570.1 hypothetical protein F6X53_29065 [Methylobacterium soli]GJE41882.1 hypothetical protein AEGHOMDF_1052 [Methylobacterium soli]
MKRRLILAGLVALAGGGTACAFPGQIPTFERVTASGHTLKITSVSAVDPTCQSLGPVTIGLIDVPHDGRIEVQQGRDFPNYSTLNTRSRCNTRKVPATLVLYTPTAGYIGEDDFTIEIVGPQGQVGRARYHISVR